MLALTGCTVGVVFLRGAVPVLSTKGLCWHSPVVQLVLLFLEGWFLYFPPRACVGTNRLYSWCCFLRGAVPVLSTKGLCWHSPVVQLVLFLEGRFLYCTPRACVGNSPVVQLVFVFRGAVPVLSTKGLCWHSPVVQLVFFLEGRFLFTKGLCWHSKVVSVETSKSGINL